MKVMGLKGEKGKGKWSFTSNHSLKQASRTERHDVTGSENIRQPGQPARAEDRLKWSKNEGTGVCEISTAGWSVYATTL